MKGVSVNPEGDSRHRHVRAKMARKESENQTRMYKKVNGKAPWDEGAEVQSPKRINTRVESEETQDYVRQSLNLSREDAEEISFVPTALSIPRGPMFGSDSRCSNKALRFWQFDSVVVDDDKESYTVNVCQQCNNKRLTAQGQAPLKSWLWKAVVEKKAHRGRLWKMLGKDQLIQGMWEYFTLLKDAEKAKQEGIQGPWQQESPVKEFLAQVNSSADTDCATKKMRFGYYAFKDGDWREYRRIFKVEVSAREWVFERIREAFEKVANG